MINIFDHGILCDLSQLKVKPVVGYTMFVSYRSMIYVVLRKVPFFLLFFKSYIYIKEGNVLFNDTLNTFYLRLYGIKHMVKDHSDSERGNPLSLHRLLFTINNKVFLYAPSDRQDSTYDSLCYTSRGALAGKRNGSTMKDRFDDPSHTMSKSSYQRAISCSFFIGLYM